MRYLRQFYLFACAVALALPAYAAGLAQLKTFLDSTRSAKGVFSQTVITKSARKPQQTAGIFAWQRPGKFRWSYEKPYKTLLVSDGEKFWSYDPDLNQVAIKKLGTAFGSSPAALLAGQDLERNFELAEGVTKDGIDFVDAKPKGRDASFENIKIGLTNNLPVSMEIHDSFGQITVLKFSQLEANPVLPPAMFRFTAPKGADVLGE